MKKSLIVSTIFILLLSLCSFANAYSTSQYSIDIPKSWKMDTTGSFVNEDGNSVNVQITKSEWSLGDPYTQANLDQLVKELYTNVDAYKEEMVQTFKESYGTYLSESEIREYVDSFKCNSVDLSEITTCTKNNYKCFHIIANYSMDDYSYYCNQYAIASGTEIYTVTVSAEEKEDFNDIELKKIVDSFTINNYKEPSGSTLSPAVIGGIVGAAVGAGVGIAAYIKNKNKNRTDL